MNTGVQRSSATPPAARTATTPAVGPSPATCSAPARTCRRSRWRTASLTSPRRPSPTCTISSARSIKAMGIHGARYIHIHVPCPLGWGSAVARHDPPRAACGRDAACSRCSRPSTATSPAARKIRRQVPVEDYLQAAEALRPSVRASRRQRSASRPSRRSPTATSPNIGLLERRGRLMDKPFAITLDVGSSLANKTGSWRTERPVYVDRLPPCNHACPAGENIQGWLYHAESGDYESAWRMLTQDNPLPGDDGPRLLSPVRKRLQPRPARRSGRHQLGRALPRRRGDQARLAVSRRPRRKAASACSSSAPARPACPRPTTCAAWATHVTIYEAGPTGRRHDALRHPEVPAAARRARCRDRSASLDLGVELKLNTQGRRTSSRR